MKQRAKIVCFEGTEGVGKTTQAKNLANYLREKGYSVLETKEPGTPHSPITLDLRKFMLDQQYDDQLTPTAREYISQAIRSIHLEKVIVPALYQYDYIIQDRGILSGLAYGNACGHNLEFLKKLTKKNIPSSYFRKLNNIYDKIIILTGDTTEGLERAAQAKQEFKAGDAMESKGNNFMLKVASNMECFSKDFRSSKISIDNKNKEQVFNAIVALLIKEGILHG